MIIPEYTAININTEIFERVIQLIEECGFEYVLAGGVARDTYFNERAKDADICVAANLEITAGEKIHKLVNTLHNSDVYDHERSEGMACSGDGHDRILEVFPLLGAIDVILWNTETTEQIVENFDYNINQFVLNDGVATFVGENFGELTMIRDLEELGEASMKRMQKMEAKAIHHGWSICTEKNTVTLSQKMKLGTTLPSLPGKVS